MRFLIDNSAAPLVAHALTRAGHDAVHVRNLGLAAAPDEQVFDLAAAQQRVLIAQDTDFGTILASRRAAAPSVILFRTRRRSGDALAAMLLANLGQLADDLAAGAIVVFDDTRIRVRRLPYG